MSLEILYHDQDLVAVAKPAGLLVHRTSLASEAQQFALQLVRDQIGALVYPVHRLDRPTSGVLLFALNVEMARAMGQEFTLRRVHKEYLAVVRGVPAPGKQIVNYPLREELDAIADRNVASQKAAQEAVTEVELLDQIEFPVQVDRYPTARYALVKARPHTGRKHQVRRHLRHLGHPIIGDVNHGVGKHNRYFAREHGVRRLLLACTSIRFRHPQLGHEVQIRAELEKDFAALLQRLNWSSHGKA